MARKADAQLSALQAEVEWFFEQQCRIPIGGTAVLNGRHERRSGAVSVLRCSWEADAGVLDLTLVAPDAASRSTRSPRRGSDTTAVGGSGAAPSTQSTAICEFLESRSCRDDDFTLARVFLFMPPGEASGATPFAHIDAARPPARHFGLSGSRFEALAKAVEVANTRLSGGGIDAPRTVLHAADILLGELRKQTAVIWPPVSADSARSSATERVLRYLFCREGGDGGSSALANKSDPKCPAATMTPADTCLDVALTVFSAALFSSRSATLCRPVPGWAQGTGGSADNVQWERLTKAVLAIPPLHEVTKSASETLAELPDDSVHLLAWLVGRLPTLLQPVSSEPAGDRAARTRPLFLVPSLEVSVLPAADPLFERLAKQHGTHRAYHGSAVSNWHSILQHGRTRGERTGSVFGEGVYAAAELQVAKSFAPIGFVGWPGAALGGRPTAPVAPQAPQRRSDVAIVAELEVVALPENANRLVGNQDSAATGGAGSGSTGGRSADAHASLYYVVANDRHVALRRLLVYTSLTAPATDAPQAEAPVTRAIPRGSAGDAAPGVDADRRAQYRLGEQHEQRSCFCHPLVGVIAAVVLCYIAAAASRQLWRSE